MKKMICILLIFTILFTTGCVKKNKPTETLDIYIRVMMDNGELDIRNVAEDLMSDAFGHLVLSDGEKRVASEIEEKLKAGYEESLSYSFGDIEYGENEDAVVPLTIKFVDIQRTIQNATINVNSHILIQSILGKELSEVDVLLAFFEMMVEEIEQYPNSLISTVVDVEMYHDGYIWEVQNTEEILAEINRYL